MSSEPPHIGTLREKPLHASLKQLYAEPGDRIECPVDGFIIDIVRGDLLIEIQTSGFSSMKQKVVRLLESGHRLRIVHPIPVDKWIVKVEDDGTITSRRRSPKHGKATNVFSEVVSFPDLLGHDALEVEVVLTVEEEWRRHEPGKAWRRQGWVVFERRLVEVVDTVRFADPADWVRLLPEGLPDPFTTSDLSGRIRTPLRTAQQMVYCLREAGWLAIVGKNGNSIQYRTL